MTVHCTLFLSYYIHPTPPNRCALPVFSHPATGSHTNSPPTLLLLSRRIIHFCHSCPTQGAHNAIRQLYISLATASPLHLVSSKLPPQSSRLPKQQQLCPTCTTTPTRPTKHESETRPLAFPAEQRRHEPVGQRRHRPRASFACPAHHAHCAVPTNSAAVRRH